MAAEGANELPQQNSAGLIKIIFGTIREPMFALLLGGGLIYLLLGDRAEALMLLFFAGSSVTIAIFQESRSERVLRSLRELTSPRAWVIRDGARSRIASREVVREDIIVLAEGDRVPADGTIIAGDDLLLDESLLTGESLPIPKYAADRGAGTLCASQASVSTSVYSGTLIVRGSGLAEVTATGEHSKLGQIGHSLAGIETATPHLTLQTRHLVRIVAFIAISCGGVAALLFGLFRGSWLQAMLSGIALIMSLVPEEFPLVLTVFMVMGAWRLSQSRILTRKAAAIENLGAATVLCTDKTGTLTENRMTIAQLRLHGEVLRPQSDRLDGAATQLLRLGRLASAVNSFDPMERAIQALGKQLGGGISASLVLAKSYPLRRDLLAVTQAWRDDAGNYLVAAKGAPEAIADLCRLDASRRQILGCEVEEMAKAGMRILGVAQARQMGSLPDNPRDFRFDFVGLFGFSDPVRVGVPAAVRECRAAGIRVIMITGDHPLTARAIAADAGLDYADMITGGDLSQLDDLAFAQVAARAGIFARIAPDQKLRLVRALQARGDVVAMSGDGVNDAPALRAADIGVAMGNRGTDVAREAASIVLLDDDFSSIVRTVRLGRRIYDNLRKAMGYIIAVHIPIAGMALFPLVTGMPLVLAPVHIALMEMVIDPVCSIVFEAEPEEEDIMRRPPRSPSARLLPFALVQWSVIQGGIALAIVLAVYAGGNMAHLADADLRTLTVMTLIGGNLGLVLVNRAFSVAGFQFLQGASRLFWVIAAGMVIVLVGATLSPRTRALFAFGTFHGRDVLIAGAATLALVLLLQAAKVIWPLRLKSLLTD